MLLQTLNYNTSPSGERIESGGTVQAAKLSASLFLLVQPLLGERLLIRLDC